METLRDKSILIVDAANEVGMETTAIFCRHAARIALCGTDEDSLDRIVHQCQTATAVPADKLFAVPVSDLHHKDQMAFAVERAATTFGRLDCLIYLCDNDSNKNFRETTIDDLRMMHIIHVESPLLWTQQAIPYLKRTKGSVVILSSGQGKKPVVGTFPYALAKAAEDQLVRTMALDLASSAVRVNAVCPLHRKETTGITVADYLPRTHHEHQMIVKNTAEYIAYLATDPASFITGQCVTIGETYDVDELTTAS